MTKKVGVRYNESLEVNLYNLLPILFAILWPVKSHDLIAQTLGTRNFGGYHTGIDILVPENTPIFAICDGTVVTNNTNSYSTAFDNYWNSFVIIEHDCNDDIIFGYYGHITSDIPKLRKVKRGQLLGYVVMAKSILDKSTQLGIDRPSNIHLHFGLNKSYLRKQWGYAPSLTAVIEAGWINPLTYLNSDN